LAKLNAVGNVSMMLYNYLGRDACGQAGGAAYAYYKGSNIKDNPRQYGHHANGLIIGSTLMESMVSYLPLSGKMMFGPLVAANVCKNIGWIGSGAVNSHYMSQLSKDNISEMYTRMSVVNSFASTVGTLTGLVLIGLCAGLSIINALSYRHAITIAEDTII
jgi:hypothetical protein